MWLKLLSPTMITKKCTFDEFFNKDLLLLVAQTAIHCCLEVREGGEE